MIWTRKYIQFVCSIIGWKYIGYKYWKCNLWQWVVNWLFINEYGQFRILILWNFYLNIPLVDPWQVIKSVYLYSKNCHWYLCQKSNGNNSMMYCRWPCWIFSEKINILPKLSEISKAKKNAMDFSNDNAFTRKIWNRNRRSESREHCRSLSQSGFEPVEVIFSMKFFIQLVSRLWFTMQNMWKKMDMMFHTLNFCPF